MDLTFLVPRSWENLLLLCDLVSANVLVFCVEPEEFSSWICAPVSLIVPLWALTSKHCFNFVCFFFLYFYAVFPHFLQTDFCNKFMENDQGQITVCLYIYKLQHSALIWAVALWEEFSVFACIYCLNIDCPENMQCWVSLLFYIH